ncbi:DNA mismatch repair endonuclease MutH [Rheinheimera sp. WS51]|uniref:DNA mismatch repair endonuclease MutH n=1 Tax=Rheinheimera sp. WS51 TaxID=3425886 RepID=UPI003D93976E
MPKNASVVTKALFIDIMLTPPQTTDDLMARCSAIAGLTLGQLAANLEQAVPKNLLKDKGWVGQLIELALGADGGSQAVVDFASLGIELKTLPINQQGKPLESTYVCVAPLTGVTGLQWHNSWVCQKLQHILWLPILAERQIPIAERIIGNGFLWQPSVLQQQALQQDWEELMELISLGGIANIRGATGKYLQLRPKAANSKALTDAVGSQGQPIRTLPRGFYLKTNFTAAILQQQFSLSSE